MTHEDLKEYERLPYPFNIAEILSESLEGNDENKISISGSAVLQLISENLSDRKRMIIEMIWRDKMTLEQVGSFFHVTRERVRQLEEKALSQIVFNARKYSSVTYKDYMIEVNARRLAEQRLDKILSNANIKMIVPESTTVEVDEDIRKFVRTEELNLSIRTQNCLRRAGYNTLEDIVNMPSEEALMKIRNMGKKGVDELLKCVHSMGIKLKWEKEY